jgi:hypothetical protein
MAAQQEVHRVGAARCRGHDHGDHWPGRAAAGLISERQRPSQRSQLVIEPGKADIAVMREPALHHLSIAALPRLPPGRLVLVSGMRCSRRAWGTGTGQDRRPAAKNVRPECRRNRSPPPRPALQAHLSVVEGGPVSWLSRHARQKKVLPGCPGPYRPVAFLSARRTLDRRKEGTPPAHLCRPMQAAHAPTEDESQHHDQPERLRAFALYAALSRARQERARRRFTLGCAGR